MSLSEEPASPSSAPAGPGGRAAAKGAAGHDEDESKTDPLGVGDLLAPRERVGVSVSISAAC